MNCSDEPDPQEPQYRDKDPDSKLDYGTSWATWLAEGEVIETSDWTITGGDTGPGAPDTVLKTASIPPPSIAGSVTFLWLEGGTLGQSYTVVNRITTNQGRTEDRSKFITIREK